MQLPIYNDYMTLNTEEKQYRCSWSVHDPLMTQYHDTEWGVPVHNDTLLFEFLILEGAQAGLSWQTILKKRENYRAAFHHFDAQKIATFTEKETAQLLANSGIVRNRLKIAATIKNAKAFLTLQKTYGSFDRYIWKFVQNNPIDHKVKSIKDIPTTTNESDEMSKALKHDGFTFVGSTICYAFMQAVGMVNDHEVQCFRYKEL